MESKKLKEWEKTLTGRRKQNKVSDKKVSKV
jgi:hypothetical protein